MLTGKMVRVRIARNKIVPQYLDTTSDELLAAADQLLYAYRDSAGRTRGELEEQTADLLGDGPAQLIFQGLAKLLEDRCDFEAQSELPPETVREAVFRLAAADHARAAEQGTLFNRGGVIHAAATELGADADRVERALFADLKDEERILTFDDISPERLLERYNVSLVQAILMRAVRLEARVWGETPARFRQLFRAVKFHQLIATVRPAAGESSYTLAVDGPMSLFSATQKYGKQLAYFLPTLLHCKAYEVRAEVRWGADRKEKLLTVTSADGLKSHLNDFGARTPRELAAFAASFREVPGWTLSDEPNAIPLGGVTWLPDFTITHDRTGREVHLDVLGFWRKLDLDAHYKRLVKALPGKFLLVVSEAYRADEGDKNEWGEEVYRFKKTPVAAEVAKLAARVAGVK